MCTLIPLTAVIGLAGWVGLRVLEVRNELTAAQALVTQMPAQVAAMDTRGLGASYDRVGTHVDTALTATADPIWRVVEHVPALGANLTAARVITETIDRLVVDFDPLVRAGQSLDPSSMAGGTLPVAAIGDLAEPLPAATAAAQQARSTLAMIDTDGVVDQLSSARERLITLLDQAIPALETASKVVPVVPSMLGADGPKRYVVMFQNNAESRSLGGSALFFAEITLHEGRISLDGIVPAGSENFRNDGVAVVRPPDGFEELAPGVFGRFIANATSRPSFDNASEIVAANWDREFGWAPDGVISIDAVALSYLLRATGGTTLSDGTVITAENVVATLLNTVPQTYNTGDIEADDLAQDIVYGTVLGQVFGTISSGGADPVQLLLAIGQATEERRAYLWSADPTWQEALAPLGLVGSVPDSDESTDRVGLYINDNVGSKLSFYLATALETSTATCVAGETTHRLSLELTNGLAPDAVGGLSPFITGQYEREKVDPGVQRIIVYAYAPTNGRIVAAAIDGSPEEIGRFVDEGHAVQEFRVSLDPGATATLSLEVVTTGGADRELEALVTPGVNPTTRTEGVLDCATLAGG